jgi:CRISPR-associated protein Csd1
MILQALYEYYLRKSADPDGGIAPQGFQWVEISFVVVIDKEGRFVTLEDQRQGEGRERNGKKFLLPKAVQRSGSKSYASVNLLWDHVGYVFGHPKSDSPKDAELAGRQLETWLESLRRWALEFNQSAALKAVSRFYSQDQIRGVRNHSLWEECVKKNGTNILFRLDGDLDPIPCLDFVQECVRKNATGEPADSSDDDDGEGGEHRVMRCLITGDLEVIARKHTKTPINNDNKSFVGIQKNSGYDSYGKTQAFNSPVGLKAEFAYTTALMHLLKESDNRVSIADSTTVFWAQRKSGLEDSFPYFWSTKDDPDQCIEAVRALLRSPISGSGSDGDDNNFYVLGLAPGGGSRISIRYWHAGPIKEFSGRIRQHFLDLQIAMPEFDKGNYALFFLLQDISLENKIENLPPNLGGDVMRAILTGGPYPAGLLQQTVRRIRAQQSSSKSAIKRSQAALLKAYLNRRRRLRKDTSEEEITVALDPTNMNPGYRLGRLFAALERIQEDAQGNLNASIRERYYGSASSSPVTVFPRLLKLKNHHLAKMENPAFKANHEKRLGEIIDGLQPEIPAHLSIEDQARFAVGYYHQRQAFFTKSVNQDNPSNPGA